MAALVIQASGRLLRKMAKHSAAGRLVADRFVGWNCFQGAKRYLLTEDVLQLRKFQENKLETEYKIYGQKDEFLRTIEEKLANNILLLKNELVILLHMCQSKNEIELVKKTIYRYHEQNRNMAFGEFKFGPIFMRLCYELDLEAVALELIKDQTLNGFFGDNTSFNILMDMLFKKGHYEDALEVLLQMQRENVRFSQDTYLLAFAICYKLNSSESWHICNTLLEDRHLRASQLSRRTQYFAVAFALKQNDVVKAHFYLSQLQHTQSIVCDNLKILLMVAFGNLKHLVETLEKASKIDTYFVRKPSFCMDVMTAAREKLEVDQQLIVQFEEIFTRLKGSGQINELTLDDLLCEVPHTKGYKMPLLKEMKRSQRTLRPLQSFLLTD